MWHHGVGRTWPPAEALLKHLVEPALYPQYRQTEFIASVMTKACRKWNFPVKQAPLAANVKNAMRPTQVQQVSLESKLQIQDSKQCKGHPQGNLQKRSAGLQEDAELPPTLLGCRGFRTTCATEVASSPESS